jgi:hypothetical protein
MLITIIKMNNNIVNNNNRNGMEIGYVYNIWNNSSRYIIIGYILYNKYNIIWE